MLILLTLQTLAAPPTSTARFEANQSQAQIEQVLTAATEEALQNLHWTARPFARPRLEPLATACPAYKASVQDTTMTVQCDDGRDPFAWTIGKSAPWTSPKGESMQVSLTRQGDVLVLDFRQNDGGKSFTYDFSGEGLRVTQQVYSKHLPQPMRWTLSYDRK